MSRVLITGAAGFVGQVVARALADKGFEVTGLGRVAPAPGTASACAKFVTCDLLGDQAPEVDPEQFDAVVHLAGRLSSGASRRDIFAVNVGATSAALQQLCRPGCQLVLFSTGLVYGAQPGPFVESMPCMATDAYGQSKLAAEALTRAWSLATGSALAVLRPSVIYGPGAPRSMLMASLMHALREGAPFPMTPGEQGRDFVHIDDVAQAVTRVLELRASGVWNIAAGQSHTIREVAERCAQMANRSDVLRVGALPYRNNEVFDYRLDIAAAQRDLGWAPKIALQDGLESMWRELT